MEIRTLRALVEVVRQGGFSRAARTVFATQSTVSKAVKQLEDELGLRLLERIGHRSRLTEAGEIVYRRALTILAQADDLKIELEELRNLAGGTLRLGFPLIGSNTLFARWFAAYRSRYPDVDIKLVENGSKRLEELVLAGELDLAASLLPISEEFEWQEVRREPIDLLLAADHPLAECDTLAFEELADMPFILYGPEFALNPIILEACRASGFTPSVATQSSQIDFIIELVAAKLGVALLPRLIAEQRPHPLTKRVAVGHPAIYWHMALVWRRGGYLSHAAQAWLALAGSPEVYGG
ncbi:LysR family transcriptional regulator [Geobacter sp. SVR]|uniref:LysR family transcriptional regulator n=1 Tax=Geobacter sp. SVR TaxID=2495594 RepID=UPI00143EF6E7|nr:LysR family transcriptional regulator [Geobacter sp. SVR]BCS52585.1 LysR family transcriptional regulator [Geobacter sp. SVR]GCF83977.1 LysR family transcriptional regulator [Geobacter sp. SVR]